LSYPGIYQKLLFFRQNKKLFISSSYFQTPLFQIDSKKSCWSLLVKERRKLERFQLHVPAKVELTDASGHHETLQLETKDISADGAFFVSPKQITEGANIRLEMILSVEKLKDLIGVHKKVELKMQGHVIRSDSDGVAVLFDRKYQIKALNNHLD
jgi:hypothetical protein